jgi:hypothetical protein
VQEKGVRFERVRHGGVERRHPYATSMLRAGVSLPALMKLPGHRTANMTLRYVEITQQDLQRKFQMARQTPRHLIPLPASLPPADPEVIDATVVVERLSTALRVLDLYRLRNPIVTDSPSNSCSAASSAFAPASKNSHPALFTKIGPDWPDFKQDLYFIVSLRASRIGRCSPYRFPQSGPEDRPPK